MKYAYLGAGRKVHRVKHPPQTWVVLYMSRCGRYGAEVDGNLRFTTEPATCFRCFVAKSPQAQEFDTWPDEPE